MGGRNQGFPLPAVNPVNPVKVFGVFALCFSLLASRSLLLALPVFLEILPKSWLNRLDFMLA
jgi:hypothetical protein